MKNKALQTALIFAIIFACHIIVFLAFYPGMCTYDLNAQISQYVNHEFSTSHPLLHTLFIGFFHDLFISSFNGTINLGYAIATLIRLIIVDSAMTYSVMYMCSLCKKYIFIVCVTAFYALFPINSMLAISHTKDTAFAAFGLIFFIDSLRILSNNISVRKNVFYIRVLINAVLMTLMRNNAIYAVVAALLIITIITSRIYISANRHNNSSQKSINDNFIIQRKYLFVLFLTTILSISGNHILMKTTDATPGSIKEMMSIPAQIMGRVYNETATDEEKGIILQYIPNAEEYKYYISDLMKLNLPFEIWESKCKHFLLDSAIISLHHPIISIEAVWYNIQGYIDPFHMPYSSDHFYLARYDYRGDAELDSKIPQLCDTYVRLFRTTEAYSHSPIVIPFNLAIYVWICIISFVFVIRKHFKKSKENTYIAFIFPLLYFMTLLLGPAAIMRYGYLYVLLAPVSISIILCSSKS